MTRHRYRFYDQDKRKVKPKKVRILNQAASDKIWQAIDQYDKALVNLFNEITEENDPNRIATFFKKLEEYDRTTDQE